ncbi:glycosyltransferase [Sphingomonas morindae]|uniref:Glycosyltransferase n=1 Tax=Sphingomonas morindae TaxID=1541170 RepID=A0ABY4X583_9SPHN|nr:glycosyltransferase [Sphingomonas morindae]USI72058.1 glycosyltransferase [Sphingomonas morindae]
MKIVDVCAFFAPRGGGVRTYVERKLVAAPARGHEVVVIAPGAEDRLEPRGPGAAIRWVKAPLFPLDTAYRYFNDRAALHALLDAERPDMVEVSSPWRSASMVAEWRGRAPIALIAHADPLSAYAYRWFGGVADRATIDRQFDWYWRHLRRLDARFDLVISASDSLSQRLRAGGLRKVVTNPMGVEANLFSPARRDAALRARLLARCGLGPEATLLLGVGRHAPEKRWEMIARAATMAGTRVPVGLVLVGGGRGGPRLRKAVAGNPHIRLLAPISDRSALATLMASADALIHGCEAETYCFAAAEATASGLPLITPDLGGAADQARAAGGLTFAAGQAAAAAAAIERFARAPITPTPPPLRTMDDHFDMLFALYAGEATALAA